MIPGIKYSLLGGLFSIFAPLHAIEPLIRAKALKNNSVRFQLSNEFSKKYVGQTFQVSYPEIIKLEELPSSIIEIPLITQIIPVIWLSGDSYWIEEMDEDLYNSLIKIKAFFKRFFYNTSWEGELIPKHLVKNVLSHPSSQSASLFTGGLDSTTTVFRHFDENLSLISFNKPHEKAAQFAKLHHLDLHVIDTNYDTFLDLSYLNTVSCDISKWFWDTSMGLSWIGAAAPLLYALNIPTLYIPSGFTWKSFLFPDGQTLSQPASPLIDENLHPIGLKVKHDVFTMTRPDKIQFLSTFCKQKKIPIPQLVVCNHHQKGNTTYTHCNRCTKCLITMLDIMAIGEPLEDYGFTLSEPQFILQLQSYLRNLRMRRGGTYVAFCDTQRYLKNSILNPPKNNLPFFQWFLDIDFNALLDKQENRPLRILPFNWNDYEDLYPGVKDFID